MPAEKSGDAQQTTAQWLLAAIIEFAQRGYLPFLVASLLLSMAAASVAYAIADANANTRRDEESIHDLLQVESIPTTIPKKNVFGEVALHLGYVDLDVDCAVDSDNHPTCVRTRLLLQRFAAFRPKPDSRDSVRLTRCGPLEAGRVDRSTALHRGMPWCESGIPVLPATDCGTVVDTSCGEENVTRSAAAIAAFSRESLDAFDLTDGVSKDDMTPVGVYFISPEGLLFQWDSAGARRGRPQDDAAIHLGSDPVFDFRGKAYVDVNFANREDQKPNYQQLANGNLGVYLDVAGQGAVRTSCRAGFDSANELFGVLCVDYRLPWKHGPLPLASFVDDAPLILQDGKLEPADAVCRDLGWNIDTAWIAPRLSSPDLLQCARTASSQPIVAGCSDAVSMVLFSQQAPCGGGQFFVAMRPHSSAYPPSFYLMTVSCGLAVLLAGWVTAVRRRQFSVDDESALIRKLQVGVLKVASSNRVVEANERAEELFGRPLPLFGTLEPHSDVPEDATYLDNLFSVRLRADGAMREFRPLTLDQVDRQRSLGLASEYFVRKAATSMGLPLTAWLHVIGSPLVGRGRGSGAETFGIFQVPTEEVQRQLEAAYVKLAPDDTNAASGEADPGPPQAKS